MLKVKRKSNLARAAMTLLLAIFCTTASWAQESLTVYEGTKTSYYVPAFINYFDDFTKSQFVVPSTMLADIIVGSEIQSIKFYTTLSGAGAPHTTASDVDVYIMEVDYTTISEFESKSDATVVYSGKLSIVNVGEGGELTITFNSPYVYNGGNILIGIENTTDVDYATIYFKGVTATGASGANYNASSLDNVDFRQRNFGPMTTFRYELPGKWKTPTGLVASDVKSSSAVLDWTENGPATSWVVGYKTEGDVDFTEVPAPSKPFTLSGLTPDVTYTVKVRPVTDDATIKWSDVITITTPEVYPKPQNVSATPMATSATIAWDVAANDDGAADSYNVRYRTPAGSEIVFFDDFENGLGNWTIYTEGEAAQTNGWYTSDPSNGLSFSAHSGNYVASSFSWNSTAYNADNWLVTPQVVFGKKLKFWVRTNSGYPDSYEVLLSTRGNDISDFGDELQALAPAPATGEWEEVVIDLTDYEGEEGYIAIHHVDYDENYLVIDDFAILGNDTEASAWQTVSSNTNSAEIPGQGAADLTPATDYECEVQAVYGGDLSAWSETLQFTTLADGVKVFTADGDWDVNANWTPSGVPSASDNVILRANVAIPAGVVAIANNITIEGGSITIKNGGELKTISSVPVTFEKNFAAGVPQLVSPPFNASITLNDLISVPGIFEGDFDFYAFDSESVDEWLNIYQYNFGFSPGSARLYGSSTDKTIALSGDVWKSKDNELSMTFTYDDTSTDFFNGWLLTGNIFPCTGSIAFLDDNYEFVPATFYKLNASGTGYDAYQYIVQLAPGEGVFVESDQSGYLYFSSEWLGDYAGIYDPEDLYAGTKDYPVLPQPGLTVDQDATPVLPLADDANNTALVEDLDGKSGCNLVLSGRTLYKDGTWNTLCLPFDLAIANGPLDGDNVQAMTLSTATIEGTKLNLTFEDAPATISAGTPFIIKWDPATANLDETSLVFSKVNVSKTMNPTEQTDIDFIGSYAPTEVGASGDNTMLYLGADNKLYWPNGAWALGAQRAYFSLKNGFCASDAEVGNAVKEFNISFGNDATGIMVLNADGTSDGKSGVWSSVDGHRISGKPTMKGVYINKGKKVFAK